MRFLVLMPLMPIPIKIVNAVKYLGIIVDNKLQFKQHIASL